jgi:outer membrane protein OmpA-like peptidoglycan-associated protein
MKTEATKVKPMRTLAMLMSLVMVAALGLSACTKAKKADGEAGAEAGMSDAGPQVTDQDMAFDREGSDGGKISGLNTIFFEYDQARLSESAKSTLKGNADWIRANPNVTIQIEGHTDSRGSTEYNLSLGRTSCEVCSPVSRRTWRRIAALDDHQLRRRKAAGSGRQRVRVV